MAERSFCSFSPTSLQSNVSQFPSFYETSLAEADETKHFYERCYGLLRERPSGQRGTWLGHWFGPVCMKPPGSKVDTNG